MGTNRVTNTYNNYKRKRNVLLAFLVLPSLLLLGTFGVLYFTVPSIRDLLYSIYIPLLLVNLLLIIVVQPRFTLYTMLADYSYMAEQPREPIATKRPLFTDRWIDDLIKQGYTLSVDNQRYRIYYKYHKVLPGTKSSDETLSLIIIANNRLLDFYSVDVDRDIQAIYISNPQFQKINKQVALQFKRFDTLSDDVDAEVEQAIVYKAGKQQMVHFTIGYISNQQAIYSIVPKTVFPNRYIYYASKELERVTYTKE